MVLVAAMACTSTVSDDTSALSNELEGFTRARITVGSEELVVLVADTPSERRRGLKSVGELPEGITGMLFVFPSAAQVGFHMKDTLIPLDIWWFDNEGLLLGSTAMEPCSGDPCLSYRSPAAVRWALETPQRRYRFQGGARLSVYSD
ncbi:MAG: DUF192 domain-containing protein [Acidimicrobiia bacterium]